MINQTVSHYKILEKLGGGGMGIVYKAEDTKLKRTVALKFLPLELTRNEEAKERFINEAQSTSALQHNNICTIHDIDETDDGQIFIVMDCYDGETLKQAISNKQLAVSQVIDIAIKIAQGLQKAHEKNIIHRDIKPANIMITNDGTVKILDFGLAKLTGQTALTKTGSTIGTAVYMSPEQARGDEVDARTDICSLGIVIYEMLTRKVPFHAEYEQAIIYKILNEKPEPINTFRKDVPKGIEHIISKALAKDPSERYQKVDEILDDMRTINEQLKIVTEKHPRSGRRKLLQIITAIIILICIAFGIKFLFFPSAEPTKQITSIAVLPFQNLSADPEQEYFSDGMTDALITELSKIKALRVISRTSIMRYKKTDKSLPEIAKELKVDAVVEGTVQRVQDLVRINTQLVRAEPEEHLWAKPFTKNLTNILEL